MLKGVSGADTIKSFDTSLFKTHFACEVKDFDPNQFIDRKEARKMDRYTQLAMAERRQRPHRCDLRRRHRRYQHL